MNRTKIEWCDWTWNPLTGCSGCSSGCANCYAAAISRRFGMPWGRPVFHPDRILEPMQVKKPGRVFVCSMSDFGHPWVDPEWRKEILAAMDDAPRHTYIILTKRPENLHGIDLSRHWVGVTAENQEMADLRIPYLLRIKAAVRFVSVEPMLGPVGFRWRPYAHMATGETYRQYLDRLKHISAYESLKEIGWMICGPETGPTARVCEAVWIEELARECREAGVAFFDKRKEGWITREWPKAETANHAN